MAGTYTAMTSGDEMDVRVLRDGRVLHDIRVPLPRRRVTEAELDRAATARVAAGSDQAAYERHVAEVRRQSVEYHGQIARVLADTAGRVWVLPSFPLRDGTPRQWIIFAPDGRPSGRFDERVHGATVRAIGTDHVIVHRYEDQLATAIEVWPLVAR